MQPLHDIFYIIFGSMARLYVWPSDSKQALMHCAVGHIRATVQIIYLLKPTHPLWMIWVVQILYCLFQSCFLCNKVISWHKTDIVMFLEGFCNNLSLFNVCLSCPFNAWSTFCQGRCAFWDQYCGWTLVLFLLKNRRTQLSIQLSWQLFVVEM